jgi:hypothetical protein
VPVEAMSPQFEPREGCFICRSFSIFYRGVHSKLVLANGALTLASINFTPEEFFLLKHAYQEFGNIYLTDEQFKAFNIGDYRPYLIRMSYNR